MSTLRFAGLAVATMIVAMSFVSPSDAATTRIKASGTVISVSPNTIQMKDPKNGNMTLNLPTDRNIVVVTGKMKPSQLQAGMLLKIKGPLVGTELTSLNEIYLIRPFDKQPLAVYTEDPAAALIIGKVVTLKDGKLTVNANKKITVPLPETTPVLIETADYSIAVAGDPIEALVYKSDNGKLSPKEIKIKRIVNPEDAAEEKKPKKPPKAGNEPPPKEPAADKPAEDKKPKEPAKPKEAKPKEPVPLKPIKGTLK